MFRVVRNLLLSSQPPSSYLLPVGEMVEMILKKMDEKIPSPQSSMKSEKLTKLLPLPTLQSRKYYKLGDSVPHCLPFPHCIIDLNGMRTLENIPR